MRWVRRVLRDVALMPRDPVAARTLIARARVQAMARAAADDPGRQQLHDRDRARRGVTPEEPR